MADAFCPVSKCEQALTAADIFQRRLKERRIGIRPDGYTVSFDIAKGMEPDEFSIGGEGRADIVAGGTIGLVHAAGFFLRDTVFSEGEAIPSVWRGKQKPVCPVRGAYWASHFHNYYHSAPMDEITRYLEDLALWGFNHVMAIYPMIDLEDENDPECAVCVDRLNAVFSFARRLGMKTATGLNVNGGYKRFPKEFLFTPHKDPTGRRGNSGNMLCPSVPEANRLIMGYIEDLLNRLKLSGLDMIITWPYDEGGCACEKCYPWGANGFIKYSKQVFALARRVFPDIVRCVSTWCFDTPEEGEWDGLAASLQTEKWCDMIMADSHEEFPKYPLENGVPGGLPMINFPEISMWGLSPWGGWGATALPERMTRLWNTAGCVLSGGFLYSEGIYEDINKAVVAQLYWKGDTPWRETLRQYARYELGLHDTGLFVELIERMERTHTDIATRGLCDTDDSGNAFAAARRIDGILPLWAKNSWRWRLVYLRAFLDARRYAAAEKVCGAERWNIDWRTALSNDDEAQTAFRELMALFHCMEKAGDDPYHSRVRPLCVE